MDLQTTIDQIAAKAGLDAAAAERAAGTILSIIQREADPALASKLFDKLPGASQLAAANQVGTGGGGLLGSLAGSIFGAKAGVLTSGLSQLEASGLTLAEIETTAASLMTYINTNAGPELAKGVAASIPMLGKPAA